MADTRSKVRATFSIEAEIRDRLERLVPDRQRSRFVEQTLEKALREKAIEEFHKFLDELPRATGPNAQENSTDFLRRLRMEMDGRPPEVLNGDADAGDRRLRHRKAS